MTSSPIWLTPLCGNRSLQDAFWSNDITVNNSVPDFTQCFQRTIFVWTPILYLLLAVLYYGHLLWVRPTVNRLSRMSCLGVIKTLLNLCLLVAAIVVLAERSLRNPSTRPPVDFLEPSLEILAYLITTALVLYDHKKGEITDSVLVSFWLIQVILKIVPFRTYILFYRSTIQGLPLSAFEGTVFFVQYGLLVLQFFVSLFLDYSAELARTSRSEGSYLLLGQTDALYSKYKPCPEQKANFVSRILFLWITRLIIEGYRRPLVFDDCYDLMPDDKCQTIVPTFEKQWQKEIKKRQWRMVKKKKSKEGKDEDAHDDALHDEHPKKKSSNSPTKDEYKAVETKDQEDEVEFKGQKTKEDKKKKPKVPSIAVALMKAYGPYYLLAGFYKLIYDIISFINPQILSLLITYIESPEDTQQWHGYAFVVAMFATYTIRTVILQQYWHGCFKVGLRMRTAMVSAVYKKSLNLSNDARKASTAGEIVNLMSVDSQKFQDGPAYLHMLWSAPLIIMGCMYFLWQQLGPSTLAGLAIMILLVPVNGVIAQKLRKLQIAQMIKKDSRIKIMNEVLNGIKVLKLYAWEMAFKGKVTNIREGEIDVMRSMQFLNAGSALSWGLAPYLVALATFAVYVLSSPENVLDANKAFVSLSLFNLMTYPLSILPATIAFAVQAAVSVGRIGRFLRNDELDPDNVQTGAGEEAISVDNGSFAWGLEESVVLDQINMQVDAGKLVAVVGQVGSGKSSLVSAMLGEMEVREGTVKVNGSVAYVPQQAWIMNASVKGNILFGKNLGDSKYQQVIDGCALKPDLDILTAGDDTEVGEKGINLSGGQKQRISLARAVYQNSDIYLLDDPLSAVDSHVGKHIFDNVIGPKGLLKNKTRVLVTNSLWVLPYCDEIFVLKEGIVSESGSYNELLSHNGPFAEFVQNYLKETGEEDADSDVEELKQDLKRQISALSDTNLTSETDEFSGPASPSKARKRKGSSTSMFGSKTSLKSDTKGSKEQLPSKGKNGLNAGRLTQDETAETGNIKFSVFGTYLKATGLLPAVFAAFCYLTYLGVQVYTNIWLSEWSNDKPINGSQDLNLRDLRLSVYGGLGGIQALLVLGQSFAIAFSCINASRVLHSSLLSNILRAPMSFFDTTPMGRIVNRFSKDVDVVDINIPMTLRIWLGTMAGVLTTIVVIAYSTPYFLIVIVPLGIFYFFVQRFYIVTSRQLKRIESIRRSPIYVHFSETISGASSLRAYKKVDDFTEYIEQLIDENNMAYYPSLVSNRWLGIWLETIGNFLVLFAGLFAVIQRGSITGGLAGLSVSYALQVTGALNMWVRMTCDLETYIVSVERIQEYKDCPQEAPAEIEGNKPAAEWPENGVVALQDYSTRYRSGLDLVLKKVNCTFSAGEKVGIVGRTGAGKSSLTLALFRIIEATNGRILIDDKNISNMGLTDLRSQLTIIPQDPVLFSGDLRMNLDPFENYADEEVWKALEHAHLKNFVTTLNEGLQYKISEGGENLSVGQRQLVCLARALLRKTKILVLDEATAAVDLETDDLIQNTIRTEFKGCSVITIAHRLNTILDYDRVLILDQGEVKEFSPPSELLQNKDSIFYGMAKDAGLV